MPRTWWVLGRKVHASRLIRVVQNEAPLLFRPAYNFLGIPQAQILWDYVCHFQENRDACNRLLGKFSTFVFKTAMSDILTGTASDLAQLDARMQILARNRTNDGVLAIDKDAEDAVKIETPIAGVSDIVRQSLEILAAMNRTPAVKLLGISPSGFNATGESDIRNYYDHIGSQQEKVIRNPLKAVLDVAQVSLWGEADAGLTFDFCPLSVVDDNSAAITQQTKINTLCALIDRNVISVEEARQVLTDDPESGFDELDPDAVPDAGDAGDMEDAGGAEPPAQEGETADTREDVARPFDVTLDGVEWRTAENGKRFQIDTETGQIVKGNVGQKNFQHETRQILNTKPNKRRYKKLLRKCRGDHMKAAHKYFQERMQGNYVKAKTDKGEIEAKFTKNSWKELRKNMNADPVKAEIVPMIPKIIASGQYQPEMPKHVHPDVSVFHTYRKKVKTSQGEKEAIVDVAERPQKNPRYLAYNLTREGTNQYRIRKRKETLGEDKNNGVVLVSCGSFSGGKIPRLIRVAGHSSQNNTVSDGKIGPIFEVVNIRFAGE